MVKLELVCQNEVAKQAVKVIGNHARTHERGDGIIYLSEVKDAYRIKTGKSIKVRNQ